MRRMEEDAGAVGVPNVDALARIPRDLVLLKMENESIMALAKSEPRDEERILATLVKQLSTYPSFARNAIYAKPVGDGKIARNLSIRAAEAIRVTYGYNRVATSVSPLENDPDRFLVSATFIDYQTGAMWQDTSILSMWYVGRDKKAKKHPEDRFFSVVVPAEKSRRAREVILRSVPAGLKSELFEHAEQKMLEGMTPEKVDAAIELWRGRGVTLEMLQERLKKTRASWTQADALVMRQLWNAIDDGESTVEEIFGQVPEIQRPRKPAATDNAAAFGAATTSPRIDTHEPGQSSDEMTGIQRELDTLEGETRAGKAQLDAELDDDLPAGFEPLPGDTQPDVDTKPKRTARPAAAPAQSAPATPQAPPRRSL